MQDLNRARSGLPGTIQVFLSSYAGAKKFALQDGTYKVDPSAELTALGIANCIGCLAGAIPVQIGLSRMAIGYEAGVQSQWGANVLYKASRVSELGRLALLKCYYEEGLPC